MRSLSCRATALGPLLRGLGVVLERRRSARGTGGLPADLRAGLGRLAAWRSRRAPSRTAPASGPRRCPCRSAPSARWRRRRGTRPPPRRSRRPSTGDAAPSWMRRLHTSTSASAPRSMQGVVPHTYTCAFFPTGRELEHRVEGGDLVDADVGHAQHVGDQPHGRLGQPAVVLLLRPPQQRDHGRGLLARRIVGDRRLGPRLVLRREGEGGGLVGVKSADGHGMQLVASWRRLARAWTRHPYRADEPACRGVLAALAASRERGKVAGPGRRRAPASSTSQDREQQSRQPAPAAARSARRRAGSRSRRRPRRPRTPGWPRR